jgi:hypothetical protein
MIRKKLAPDLIRGGNRFSRLREASVTVCDDRLSASAGEGRSEKSMLNEAGDDLDIRIPARRLCRLRCTPPRWNSNGPPRVDRPSCITPTLRPLKAGPPHFRCSDDTPGQCGRFRAGCLVVHQGRNRTRLAGILRASQRLAAAIAAPRREIGQA